MRSCCANSDLPLRRERLDRAGGREAGFDREDLAAFAAALDDVRLGGAPFRRQMRLAGRERVVELRAALAPPPARPGTVLVWLFDISDADADRAKLARRLQQTEGALDALTHLIESAPFPMWYRGPDLSLGLVNAAFVAAVEGRDAAEVIERGTRADRRSWRGKRPRRRRERARDRQALFAHPAGDDRPGTADAADRRCSACRPERWPASRSTSRTSRMRGSSWRAIRNRSANWPTE